MKRNRLAGIAVAICCVAGGTALAHQGAKGIVKQRMEMMKEMADAMKAIAPIMKGEAAYEASAVQDFASGIAEHAGHIGMMFPKGSGGHPSEASARIWQEWERFHASAEELGDYANELEAKAGDGEQPARLLFGKIAGTCKGCHQSFREETK